MLKLRTARRTLALTAAGLALAGGAAIGASGTAQAATTSCTPTITNIGDPGNIYVYGVYAGQVEQQYDGCGSVRAHFQYDHNYWLNHSGTAWSAHPCVQTLDYMETACAVGDTVDLQPDVYSDSWVGIHSDPAYPDTWQAVVTIPNGCSEAGGSWHAYANGATWGAYSSC